MAELCFDVYFLGQNLLFFISLSFKILIWKTTAVSTSIIRATFTNYSGYSCNCLPYFIIFTLSYLTAVMGFLMMGYILRNTLLGDGH